MISDKSSLASRLGWIIGELEPAIEQARDLFAQYTQSNDGEGLSSCRETCRQIWGILDVLGADGANMLAQELVTLLDALIQHNVSSVNAAQEAAAEGLLQLSEYLNHLKDGYADLPVVILPTLNNLRAARDATLLSEHLVFLPEAGHATNAQIGTDEFISLTPDRLQQVTTKLRFYFQKALLGWFKGENTSRMLQAAGKVSHNLLVLSQTQRLRALWWITSALNESLEQGRLEHSVAVKMLMGRMEREIRHFGEVGEASFNQSLPDELFKNLLYYIGIAESGGEQTDKVKAAYHLDLYLPQGETLEQLRQHYATPGRDLWHAVARSVIEELKDLQTTLEGMQDKTRQAELFPKLTQKTSHLAGTLSMIGLGPAAELTRLLGDKLIHKTEQQEEQTLDDLLHISTHFVRLEKVLEEYARTGVDTTESVFSTGSENHDPDSTRNLIRTVQTELTKAQMQVIAFYKEGWAFYYLEEVIALLENISGALRIAEMHELLPLVDTSLYYLREDLLARQRQPSAEELATFADVLTLTEAALSSHLQNEDYLSLLPTGYAKLQELDRHSEIALLENLDLESLTQEVEAKKKRHIALCRHFTNGCSNRIASANATTSTANNTNHTGDSITFTQPCIGGRAGYGIHPRSASFSIFTQPA